MARRFYYTEPDWEMEDVPVEAGFGMDVTRCVVAEFFESLGMSEFCERVICDQDARDAAHRGIEFARTGTLAGGASRCDFRYHLPAPEPGE
jgi:ubiquinone biosynthesis protein